MGPWSFWSFSLLTFALLDLFPPKLQARAELSSLTTNDRFRVVATRVNRKSKVSIQGDDSAKVFSPFITETDASRTPRNGTENWAPIAIRIKPDCDSRGEKCRNSAGEAQAGATVPENTISERRDRVKRSKGMSENMNGETRGETMAKRTFGETIQAVSNSRAEYWRNGDDARGSNPRQNEPHLDTSTFALAGDSAHNQAMVHWSGHNSSVSSSLTSRTFECMCILLFCLAFSCCRCVKAILSLFGKDSSYFYARVFQGARGIKHPDRGKRSI